MGSLPLLFAGAGAPGAGVHNVSTLTVLWMESFDHMNRAHHTLIGYPVSEKNWAENNGSAQYTIDATEGSNGTYAAKINGWGRGAFSKNVTAMGEGILGFSFDMTALPTPGNETLVQLLSAGTSQLGLRVTPTGGIELVSGVTSLGSYAAGLITGTRYYIELKFSIDSATGLAVVRVDDETVLTVSGIDNDPDASGAVDQIFFGDGGLDGQGGTLYIDDVYLAASSDISQAHYFGPIIVKADFATGNGATNNFTPSAGTNYENVDEHGPDDATTYNSTTTPGHTDLFTFPTITFGVDVPRAVQVVGATHRHGGSIGQTAHHQHVSRPGSTDYVGATKTATGYFGLKTVFNTNGDTSLPWTGDEVNAAQFGIKFVTGGSAPGIRCSQLVREVMIGPA